MSGTEALTTAHPLASISSDYLYNEQYIMVLTTDILLIHLTKWAAHILSLSLIHTVPFLCLLVHIRHRSAYAYTLILHSVTISHNHVRWVESTQPLP